MNKRKVLFAVVSGVVSYFSTDSLIPAVAKTYFHYPPKSCDLTAECIPDPFYLLLYGVSFAAMCVSAYLFLDHVIPGKHPQQKHPSHANGSVPA
jgi:hypothetical protein